MIYAKKKLNGLWLLYDIYKLASNFSVEISLFGTIPTGNRSEFVNLKLTEKFQRKSTRLDLKGIHLNCGLVVSIY